MIENKNHRIEGSSNGLPSRRDIFLHNYKDSNPFNLYRYGNIKLKGTIIIRYIKNIESNNYILEIIKDKKNIRLEPSTQIELWNIIEIVRSKENKLGYIIEVRDLDTKTIYKKLTIGQTLTEIEQAKEIELDKRRHKRDRARFVLRNLPTKKIGFRRGIDKRTW
tara:strand:+ start:160 stop:651 length:492 start_codon:yes stop_codon:yes gene_type:complete